MSGFTKAVLVEIANRTMAQVGGSIIYLCHFTVRALHPNLNVHVSVINHGLRLLAARGICVCALGSERPPSRQATVIGPPSRTAPHFTPCYAALEVPYISDTCLLGLIG